MPWPRNAPDPLEDMRRKLAEQERLLAEQVSRLHEQLDPNGAAASAAKPVEPPVWRLEDDGISPRPGDGMLPRKRNLARQRQRDKMLFFIALAVLIVVVIIFLWVAYARNTAPNTGP